MMRMIVGFDPSKAQAAIAELRAELAPGVQWRVLNLDQNPNGVEPARAEAKEEHHGLAANLFHRLAGWFGKANDQTRRQERKPLDASTPASPETAALELTEAELVYLRHAPARAGTVILVTAPDLHASAVRMWSLRHGGFDLAPVPAAVAEAQPVEA
jgi:hypothetical protein